MGNLQCVVDYENFDENILKQVTTGAAISVSGSYVESQGKGQVSEIQVKELHVYGSADPETYPIQPKKHSFEFLREKAHLRIRTATFSAVMRVRAALSFGVHKFFQEEGFHYVNTPIITGSDAEGAGEMFRVSTLDAAPPLTILEKSTIRKTFLGKKPISRCLANWKQKHMLWGWGKYILLVPHLGLKIQIPHVIWQSFG